MKASKKRLLWVLILLSAILTSYVFWLSQRSVEIVGVHQNGNHSYVLVKNFPFSDQGKISWWLENKDMLKVKYKIPELAKYGSFTVIFWLFGEGYKDEGKYDRLCFDDMPPPKRCIDKEAIFSVEKSTNLGTIFTVYNGGDYRLNNNGKVVEIHRK